MVAVPINTKTMVAVPINALILTLTGFEGGGVVSTSYNTRPRGESADLYGGGTGRSE